MRVKESIFVEYTQPEDGKRIPSEIKYIVKNLDLSQEVKIKKLNENAVIPKYAREGDSGFDLYSVGSVLINPFSTAIIPTGLAFAIPEGFEMQIRMRSGASLKTPLIVANSPGTIDSGYRGEVGILVKNISQVPYRVDFHERIAQGVIVPVVKAQFLLVDELPKSERGEGAYGSTGNK